MCPRSSKSSASRAGLRPSFWRRRSRPRKSCRLRSRGCCLSIESRALAHPPPLVGAGRGGGSRRPRRMARFSRRVGQARPPSLILPHHRASEGRPSVGRALGGGDASGRSPCNLKSKRRSTLPAGVRPDAWRAALVPAAILPVADKIRHDRRIGQSRGVAKRAILVLRDLA